MAKTFQLPPDDQGSKDKLTELWMVPYADLMSVLVILFLGFYAYAQLNEQNPEYEETITEFQQVIVEDAEDIKWLAVKEQEAQLAQRLKKELEGAEVAFTSKKIQLTFAAPVLFDSGSADLKKGAARVLAPIVDILSTVGNPVVVEGHTDNRPVSPRAFYKTNFELGTLRAFSVIEHFAKEGLEPRRFSAYGYGEHKPVASNDTAEGRAKNRRIELYVVRGKAKKKL